MALEITNVFGLTSNASPRILRNLIPSQIGLLSKTQLTGGVVTSAGDDNSVTCVSGAGGRAYVNASVDILADKFYILMARFSDTTITFTRQLNAVTTTDLVAGLEYRTIAGDGLYCAVFGYSANKTLALRIGAGTSNTTATSETLTISDLCMYELDVLPGVGDPVPPVNPRTLIPFPVAAFITEFASTYSAAGLITEAAGTVPLADIESYRVGCYVSDSFGNDSGDWPDLLAQDYGLALYGGSWSGQTMDYFNARAADVFSRSGLTNYGDAPADFALIQSSLNSVNAAQTATQMLATMSSLIDKAVAAGLKPFVTTITPFGAGMTTGERAEMEAYNAALPFLCSHKNAVLIDVSGVLSDPADRTILLAAYDSGDGIHPNATGMQAYADYVSAAITRQRLIESTINGLTSRYRSSSARSLIGNLIS